MIRLRPLTEQEWEPIQRETIAEYAREHVRGGRWGQDEALDKAREELDGLLPDGIHTEGHTFYAIVDSSSGKPVGHLWFQEKEKAGKPCIFLCDLRISEPFQRRGFARAAMEALEDVARQRGARRIELHVFGHNEPARRLYASVGYAETHVMMAKDLVP
jgi:RimJ/RimL family protein N-acetyltransferase